MDSTMTSLVTRSWRNRTGNVTFPPEIDVWDQLNFWVPPICFVLGITGNSLCLAALCIARSLVAPATRIYMALILLAADIILTSSIVRWLCTSLTDYLPRIYSIDVVELDVVKDTLLTDIGCQLMDYFRSAMLFVLVWLLVAMTGERYVTLARPFTIRRKSGCTAASISMTVLLVGFGAAVSRFFTVTVVTVIDPATGWSHQDCGLNDWGVIVLLADVLILYLLPPVFLAVLAVCLSCMMCEYRRYRRRCQRMRPGRNNNKLPRPELLSPPQAELTVTMSFIYAGGLLPLFAWSILTLVSVIWGEDPLVDTAATITLTISKLLVLVLTASNFSYFIFAGTRFRRVLIGMLCGCVCTDIADLEDDNTSMQTGSGMSNGYSSRANSTAQINLAFDDRAHTDSTQL